MEYMGQYNAPWQAASRKATHIDELLFSSQTLKADYTQAMSKMAENLSDADFVTAIRSRTGLMLPLGSRSTYGDLVVHPEYRWTIEAQALWHHWQIIPAQLVDLPSDVPLLTICYFVAPSAHATNNAMSSDPNTGEVTTTLNHDHMPRICLGSSTGMLGGIPLTRNDCTRLRRMRDATSCLWRVSDTTFVFLPRMALALPRIAMASFDAQATVTGLGQCCAQRYRSQVWIRTDYGWTVDLKAFDTVRHPTVLDLAGAVRKTHNANEDLTMMGAGSVTPAPWPGSRDDEAYVVDGTNRHDSTVMTPQAKRQMAEQQLVDWTGPFLPRGDVFAEWNVYGNASAKLEQTSEWVAEDAGNERGWRDHVSVTFSAISLSRSLVGAIKCSLEQLPMVATYARG
ncbi:hypothetical protein LTR86_005312 [Recurvomyces mirabilis]|nr:hypothetical protein LTR86_005312 [Recurvomyces mirabilis]